MIGLSGVPRNDDDIWEVLQLLSGDIYIYHKGFKEEADVKDVYKFNVESEKDRFIRLDKSLLKPAGFSPVRLNRAVIAVAWYVDPDSEVVQELKKAFPDTAPVIERKR